MLFRKEILDNRKSLLLAVVTAWGLCILFGSLLGFIGRGGGLIEVTFFFLMIQFIANIYASLTFSNMKSKESRISTLMLPASAFSKFFVRWTIAVPGVALICLSGFYIGDSFRMLVDWIIMERPAGSNYYHLVNPFTLLPALGFDSPTLTANVVLSYVFGQALYVFGSILWPRLSFIKTFACIYVIEMILGIIALTIDKVFSFSLDFDSAFFRNLDIWGIVVQSSLILLLYWLSYRRLRESEVVYKLF